jgi:glutamate-ammonia-ligase adenylyltransferase
LRDQILSEAGFRDPERAYVNLRNLAGASKEPERRVRMAKLAILATDILRHQPDPDMALNNWEHFVHVLSDPQQHFSQMMSQPMRLELLLAIFSNSQFLSDGLVRNPEFLEWATDPRNLHRVRMREEHEQELRPGLAGLAEEAWMNALRCHRRREFLRIGTRDICLKATLADVTRDLSELADALINLACERAWLELPAAVSRSGAALDQSFCILAFGKLGGRELNYSSDIDLVAIYDDSAYQPDLSADFEPFTKVMESVQNLLSHYTGEGYVYRVDLRLRPYGIGGQLVVPLSGLIRYYQSAAELSEVQSLLKMRPVAGHLPLGQRFLEAIRPILLEPRERDAIVRSIEKIRTIAMEKVRGVQDVKSGLGGIRDIEFLVQGLQLIHGALHPGIVDGNTAESLEKLGRAGLLPQDLVSRLTDDYVFLRRVEHYLQILEDRQIHALPTDETELTALAKRMLGVEANAGIFMEDLNSRLKAVREAYLKYLVMVSK